MSDFQTFFNGIIPEGERWDKQRRKKIEEVKQSVKDRVSYDQEKEWGAHINTLVKQGNLLSLAKCQNTDLNWKSYIFNLKKGTMKFILNSTLDTLPHNVNLKAWGKSPSDRCPLPGCGGRQSTCHILSTCAVSRNQGRMTWRHDNILTYFSQVVDKSKYEVYIDIPGHKTASAGTIPAEVGLVTLDRPDIVILDRKENCLHFWELTVSFETNFDFAHTTKQNKYAYLLTDVTTFKPSVTAFEIGARGFVSKQNGERLKLLHKFCKPGLKLKQFVDNISAISVNSSYFMFINRKEGVWCEPPPLCAPFNTF